MQFHKNYLDILLLLERRCSSRFDKSLKGSCFYNKTNFLSWILSQAIISQSYKKVKKTFKKRNLPIEIYFGLIKKNLQVFLPNINFFQI